MRPQRWGSAGWGRGFVAAPKCGRPVNLDGKKPPDGSRFGAGGRPSRWETLHGAGTSEGRASLARLGIGTDCHHPLLARLGDSATSTCRWPAAAELTAARSVSFKLRALQRLQPPAHDLVTRRSASLVSVVTAQFSRAPAPFLALTGNSDRSWAHEDVLVQPFMHWQRRLGLAADLRRRRRR